MIAEPLLITDTAHSLMLTLHRPQQRNSLNQQLIMALHDALDHAERNSNCRFVILQGENGIFCTGMDFQEAAQTSKSLSASENTFFNNQYLSLLKRFTTTSKVVISLIDGQVLAGGVGIAAASDLVLSTSRTQFGLSEALWGLLPACVLPFLIRRIGFQKAYAMTLTTQTVNATEAQAMGLIDELTENLGDSLRRLQLRLNRIGEETVKDLKAYFRKLWIITESMEKTAVDEISRLLTKPQVQTNIKNFIEHQQFPWETAIKEQI